MRPATQAALSSPLALATQLAELELLVVRMGEQRWGLETRHVQEVLPLRGLTPLPGAPSFVCGIVNVRGWVAAVLDLRRLLGLAEQGLSDLHRIVLLAHAGSRFGLLVGMDVTVQRVPDLALGPLPPVLQDANRAVARGATADGLIVLDIAGLCSDPRMVVDDASEG